jgi:glycosyltransferase involved in cell wall biosynthesis
VRPPPRIIFLNRFFYPDHSATSQILSDLAFHLAQEGWAVSVIAGRQRYDAPEASLPKREKISGVEIHRVPTTRFGRHRLAGRALDYLTFYLTAAWALLRLAGPGAIVVVKTDPPLFSLLALPIARLRRATAVNWLQDLYPEVAERLGVRLLGGPLGRILRELRNHTLRTSRLNIAIGEDMARLLREEKVPAARIRVLANWVDDERIWPISPEENPLRADWGLQGKFVVAYSGNLGRAHEVDTILSAAGTLANRSDIVFLFIGGGHEMDMLKARFDELGAHALFKPYQPREALSQSLSVGDAHWLSLKEGLDGLILPSKFYGILAAGRPVLAIGGPTFELGRLAEEAGCGQHIRLGDGAGLAAAISELAGDPESRLAIGGRARSLLEQRFTKAATMRAWQALLASAADEPSSR